MQTLDTWSRFIGGKEVDLPNHAVELYFEVSDMDEFYKELQMANAELVHEPLEHTWGQRSVRFYDPDRHVIEVGEDMAMVVKRFSRNGMTEEEIAKRMDVPRDYVRECLHR